MLIIPTAFICEKIGHVCSVLIGGVLITGTNYGIVLILRLLESSEHQNYGYVIGMWVLWLFYGKARYFFKYCIHILNSMKMESENGKINFRCVKTQ